MSDSATAIAIGGIIGELIIAFIVLGFAELFSKKKGDGDGETRWHINRAIAVSKQTESTADERRKALDWLTVGIENAEANKLTGIREKMVSARDRLAGMLDTPK